MIVIVKLAYTPDHVDINLGNFQRFFKKITTGKIIPKRGLRWNLWGHQRISEKFL